MGGNNFYPKSQDNFMILIVWIYTILLRTFTTIGKNYSPHFILNVADFIITPNRNGTGCLGGFRKDQSLLES